MTGFVIGKEYFLYEIAALRPQLQKGEIFK